MTPQQFALMGIRVERRLLQHRKSETLQHTWHPRRLLEWKSKSCCSICQTRFVVKLIDIRWSIKSLVPSVHWKCHGVSTTSYLLTWQPKVTRFFFLVCVCVCVGGGGGGGGGGGDASFIIVDLVNGIHLHQMNWLKGMSYKSTSFVVPGAYWIYSLLIISQGNIVAVPHTKH